MIRDIPTREDFEEQGMTLLNLAWDTVIDLLLNYRDAEGWAEEWDAIIEEEQTEHYLKASQKPLAIATALLQQGTEFLVKSAIAEVSPFLLIAGNSQSWPKKCDIADTAFSAFRTADADDLIRIHDTVATNRFTDTFTQQFSEMRRVRNTVFHSVDRNLRFSEKDILLSILTVTSELRGPHKWMADREKYLDSTPSAAFVTEGHGFQLVREFQVLIDLLGNSDLEQHFGFNKKQRRYLCSECRMLCSESYPDLEPRTAHLEPNSSTATFVYCVVCRTKIPVVRKPCSNISCPGNVINDSERFDPECLTCGEIF
ncbi:MAG: hypothetical protein KME47_17975 [Nodosilinea sp. WJT8-NPBG4]|jgi:hypothetical protein|nr:hypothetical protein [Nodosilinea sp. WJT8-NPBG4]